MTEEPPRSSMYGAMAVHVCCAAGTYVLGSQATGPAGFRDPAALTLLRGLIASALCLLLTGTVIPRPKFTRSEWIQVAALGALLVPLNQYLFLAGLAKTVPSHPALIYALTPAGVLALSAVIDRRPPPRRWLAGVSLALAGVLLVLEPWTHDESLAQVRHGDLLVFAGLFIWIVYTIGAGRLMRTADPRTVTSWTLILGTLFFAPFGWGAIQRTDFGAVEPRAWAGLLWLAAITSTFMMLLWNGMLRRLEPVQVAVCANAQPAATGLLTAGMASLGWISGDQRLGVVFWAGTALVVTGVAIVQRGAAGSNRT